MKTRDQRKQELIAICQSSNGIGKLMQLYTYAQTSRGIVQPAGASANGVIERILDIEFPTTQQRRGSAE